MTDHSIPYSVGIDIVENDRIERAIDRHGDKILKRLFSEEEIEYCRKKKLYGHHFAARFAAKEAVVKAATPVCRLHYRQIEVRRAESGMPSVRIHGCDELTGREFRLSISHSVHHSVAMALMVYQ
jgi:holo-[acyl-carrier protein] synthase